MTTKDTRTALIEASAQKDDCFELYGERDHAHNRINDNNRKADL